MGLPPIFESLSSFPARDEALEHSLISWRLHASISFQACQRVMEHVLSKILSKLRQNPCKGFSPRNLRASSSLPTCRILKVSMPWLHHITKLDCSRQSCTVSLQFRRRISFELAPLHATLHCLSVQYSYLSHLDKLEGASLFSIDWLAEGLLCILDHGSDCAVWLSAWLSICDDDNRNRLLQSLSICRSQNIWIEDLPVQLCSHWRQSSILGLHQKYSNWPLSQSLSWYRLKLYSRDR